MLQFSFFLTVISIIVHLSTYIGVYFLKEYYSFFSASYIIHALIFIPFFTMIFRAIFGKNKIEKITFVEGFNPKIVFKKYLPNTDYKIGVILLLILIYVFINFYISINMLENGSPEIIDGKYVLNDHGEIAEIDKDQYVKMRYAQIKAFSGHWIIFSIIPYIYFRDRKKSNETNNKE